MTTAVMAPLYERDLELGRNFVKAYNHYYDGLNLFLVFSDQSEVVIVNVNIINPGRNYQDGDSVTDNFGNEYDITIQNGAITKVKPLTSIAVDELPELDINSSTGFGAIINPEIDIRPDDDGEVKQVIDCIT